MNSTFVVAPYGRRYSVAERAIADWEAGKDFKILHGPYCSIRDFDKMLDRVTLITHNQLINLQKGI